MKLDGFIFKFHRKIVNRGFRNKFCRILQSIYLCLHYPFLYPRNRFTGEHYNNYKVSEVIRLLEQEPLCNNKGIVIIKSIIEKYYSFLRLLHFVPTYTELDALDDGWRKRFGAEICEEIKQALLKHKGAIKQYRITDIKEKYGYLHWYSLYSNDEINDIISKYENISAKTCIVCGAPATKMTVSWIRPYCDEHAPDYAVTFEEYEKIEI